MALYHILEAVDEIAARFTRLIGIGAVMGIVAASDKKVWGPILHAAGLDVVGLDDSLRKLATLALAVFAMLQGFGVAVLIGDKMRDALDASRGLTKLVVVPTWLLILIATAVIVSEVNSFAASLLANSVVGQ